jgi:hypothetical protein
VKIPLSLAGSALALAVVIAPAEPGVVGVASDNRQSFTITFDLATPDEPGVVEADGPISGQGLVYTTERDTGRAFHETELYVFAGGNVAVSANGVFSPSTFDASTCTEITAFRGTFKVNGGTGEFAAASGHGHFSGRTTITFAVDPASPEGCDFDEVSGSVHGEAVGVVRL